MSPKPSSSSGGKGPRPGARQFAEVFERYGPEWMEIPELTVKAAESRSRHSPAIERGPRTPAVTDGARWPTTGRSSRSSRKHGGVALTIPTGRRPTAPELAGLVLAVRDGAHDEIEGDALEWKRTLDLSSNLARFDLARHLLGFGNRTIQRAQRTFDGYAYLLIGVQPGELAGVVMPDPAELNNALSRFVADGHPLWHPERVEVEGRTVLVLEVAPPHDGDRICTLQRDFDKAAAGRIFVRRPGQTLEAGPAAVHALEERYAASALEQAQHAVELQARGNRLSAEHLELERQRDGRERQQEAERQAPDFVAGRYSQGLAYTPPDLVAGTVRNGGGGAAVVKEALLHHPGGMVPGAMAVLGGPTATGEPCSEARVQRGDELLLRFGHGALRVLDGENGPLTLVLVFGDELGFGWRQRLVLRRAGGDAQGRPVWTVRPEESERELEHRPVG